MHKENELYKLKLQQKIEESLSLKLGIPSLRSGQIVIRDERDWRTNEKQIEYCWLINIAKSFTGWCWLFTIKFNESKFRDIINPEESIQGIFTINGSGLIDQYYAENSGLNFRDIVRELTVYDLFTANRGFTLDGIEYDYLIFAPNTEIRMQLNNPNSEDCEAWKKAVLELGMRLSEKSGFDYIKRIFH